MTHYGGSGDHLFANLIMRCDFQLITVDGNNRDNAFRRREIDSSIGRNRGGIVSARRADSGAVN